MSQELRYLLVALLVVLLVLYVYSGAVATWHLNRSEYFTPFQKKAQLVLIWGLPIIGVAIVLQVLGPDERKVRPGWVPILEPLVLAAFMQSASDVAHSASCDFDDSNHIAHPASGDVDCGGGSDN
jgi:hypothetical protein